MQGSSDQETTHDWNSGSRLAMIEDHDEYEIL
jgi:hypothetical protein